MNNDTKHLTVSAGGILYRRSNGATFVVVVQRQKAIEAKWLPILRQLPKGRVEDGESLEKAALREVHDETGFNCKIIGFAGTASWSYERTGKFWVETVHYYLMNLASDVQSPHDDEFEEVVWMPVEEAAQKLSYPEERDLLRQAIKASIFK